MKVHYFPGCCTAFIIEDLWYLEKERIIEEAYRVRDAALLVAITTQDQKRAFRVLNELGFSKTEAYNKRWHEDTQITLWWKHIPTLLKEQGVEVTKTIYD